MTNAQAAAPSTIAGHCKACGAELDMTRSRGEKNGYKLLSCSDCETVTVNPFPTAEELTAYYQAYTGSKMYKPKEAKKIRRSTGRVKRMKKISSGKTFLDIGCNCGFTVKAALNEGLDAKGIDIDTAAVQYATETFSLHFNAISVQDYAAKGHKADMVYTSEVIEHVPDPDGFVKAIADILEPSGVLYLTTPQGNHWSYPQDISNVKTVHPPSHITYFSKKGISILLEKHGIVVEKFFFSLKPGIRLIARKKSNPYEPFCWSMP
jgi:SAM-dependent methyltransferase